jgi:methylated-DNA-[protein]-cysteine S-methyltransferase
VVSANEQTLLQDELQTPLGRLVLATEEGGALRLVGFYEGHPRIERELGTGIHLRKSKNPGGATAALDAYFNGELAAIEALPVSLVGTPFQVSVWRALLDIPCGETRSYGDIARRIGNPNAVRAVGTANNRNSIGIVVPCHRVIGADGSMTGYGGGIERKQWLLAHESGGRRGRIPTAVFLDGIQRPKG